jgi:hypothetical protein
MRNVNAERLTKADSPAQAKAANLLPIRANRLNIDVFCRFRVFMRHIKFFIQATPGNRRPASCSDQPLRETVECRCYRYETVHLTG